MRRIEKIKITSIAILVVCGVVSCRTLTHRLEKGDQVNNRLGLSFAKEDRTSKYIDSVYSVKAPEQFEYTDENGNVQKLISATTDEDGNALPTMDLQGVTVEARLKNIAERFGKVNMDFIITVPKVLIDDRWQLRVYPRAFKKDDQRIDLEPLVLSGADFLRMQEKGYQQYKAFIASIVPDSLYWKEMVDRKGVSKALSDLELSYHNAWQKELLIKEQWIDWRNNLNRRYTLFNNKMERNRLSIDPEESILAILPAYWLKRDLNKRQVPKTFAEYAWGNKSIVKKTITPEDSLEIERRFTDINRIAENERKKQEKEAQFNKLVKFPHIAAKLDSIVQGNQDFRYYYTQELEADAGIKKIQLVLNGEVVAVDLSTYEVPRSDTLTYFVSAMVDFIDEAPRYKTEVIYRQVDKVLSARIDFKQGQSIVDPSYSNNTAELNKVKDVISDFDHIGDLVLDSLSMTGYASPEGSFALNERLSNQRTEALKQYLMQNKFFAKRPSIRTRRGGENWAGVEAWIKDSVNHLSPIRIADLTNIIHQERDLDRREQRIKDEYPNEYDQMKSDLYPSLRMTEFRFHTHRAEMQKDTIHTTVIDDVYNQGRDLLRNRDYKAAIQILKDYPTDYNYAICLMSMGYDRPAMEILEHHCDLGSADVLYLLSILKSRFGDISGAVSALNKAASLNSRVPFRAELDPELNKLVKEYNLFSDVLNF